MDLIIKEEPLDSEQFTDNDSIQNWSTTEPSNTTHVNTLSHDVPVSTEPMLFIKLEEIKTETDDDKVVNDDDNFIKTEITNDASDVVRKFTIYITVSCRLL